MPRKNPRPLARKQLARKRVRMSERKEATTKTRKPLTLFRPPAVRGVAAAAGLLGFGGYRG